MRGRQPQYVVEYLSKSEECTQAYSARYHGFMWTPLYGSCMVVLRIVPGAHSPLVSNVLSLPHYLELKPRHGIENKLLILQSVVWWNPEKLANVGGNQSQNRVGQMH